MKNFKKISSVAMTGALLASVLPTVALADTTPQFTQSLLVDNEVTATPSVTIDYTVTPNQDNGPTVTIPSVTFGSGDNLSISEGKKMAQKQVNINISNLPTHAGTYTYTVTGRTTVDGVTFVSGGDTRTLELKLGYAVDEQNVPTGPLKVIQAILKNGNEKNNGFTVEKARDLSTPDLKLTKIVRGNQADTSHYFAFNVEFIGTPNTTINVDYSDATKEITDLTNCDFLKDDGNLGTKFVQPSKVDTDASGKGSITVYLKHNQTVVFKSVPETFSYTISEVVKGDDGSDVPEPNYTTTWSVDGVDAGNGTSNSTGSADNNQTGKITIGRTEDHVTFVNTLNATVDTGVVTTIVPFASMMVVAALGYVAVKAKKHED